MDVCKIGDAIDRYAESTAANRERGRLPLEFPASDFFLSIPYPFFYSAEAVTFTKRKKYARTDDSCYDFFSLSTRFF